MEGLGLTIIRVTPSTGPLMLSTGMSSRMSSSSTGTVHITHFPSEENFWPKDHQIIRFKLRLRMKMPLTYTLGRMGVQLAPCSSYLGSTTVVIEHVQQLTEIGKTFEQRIGKYTVKFKLRYIRRSADVGRRPSFLPPLDARLPELSECQDTVSAGMPSSPSQCFARALPESLDSPIEDRTSCAPNYQPHSSVIALSELNEDVIEGWTPGLSPEFHLRVGPDYVKNNMKAPSPSSIYDCVFFDVIRCSQMNTNCVNRLVPPPKTFLGEAPHVHGIPPYLVINCIIPLSGPLDWFSAGEEFSSVIFVGRISDTAVSLPRNDPGLMLWKRYISQGNEETTESSSTSLLLKLITRLDNLDEISLPSWAKPHILQYNGKPILMQKETTMRAEDDWIELSINANKVNIISRSLITKLRPQMTRSRVAIGITIQGVDDDELPERLLLSAKMQNLNLETAARFTS